jgi:hypothetical protein
VVYTMNLNEEQPVTIKLIKVLRTRGVPYAFSYKLIDHSKGIHFIGKIRINKKRIFAGMFKRWIDITYNPTTGYYEFPDPKNPHAKNYRVYKEVIDLVDSFLVETQLIG